ncbi:MAG: CYTH and CHAD domain-containing protein [Dechloromonas sp.]|nr:CYTH and CHAD domain-containing protein [Dechloromonas sp.]
MATEIELKLAISGKAARQLIDHPQLVGHPPQRLRLLNTYYDTPHLDLHDRRIALRFRKKGTNWLLTVKTAEAARGGLAVRQEWEYPAQPGEFDFTAVGDDALRHVLDTHRPQLRPVFTTHFTRLLWHLPHGNARIEMALDRGTIDSDGRTQKISEVELELLEGDIADLFSFAQQLQQDIALRPAIASKAESGYRLFKRTPPRPARSTPSPVRPGQTPIQAFRLIALACLEQLQRNEAGLLTNNQPEYIHQARVAIRRLRSALALFAPLLPAEFQKNFRKPWKKLADTLGTARNWDVFIDDTLPPILAAFPDTPAAQRLRKAARQQRRGAGQAVAAHIGHADTARLWLDFTAALYALPEVADLDLAQFAQQQIAEQSQRTEQIAARFAELDAHERHQLRLAYKKLRYTTDFMAPLLAHQASRKQLATLSQLQDALGQINDLITAQQLLNTLQPKRTAGPVDGWLTGRHQLLIDQLPNMLAPWLARQGH